MGVKSFIGQVKPRLASRVLLVGALVAVLGSSSPLFADGYMSNTFTNNTPGQVTALRIEYSSVIDSASSTEFPNVNGQGTKVVNFSVDTTGQPKLAILVGGTVKVKAHYLGRTAKVAKWSWYNNGTQIGTVERGCRAPDCSSP